MRSQSPTLFRLMLALVFWAAGSAAAKDESVAQPGPKEEPSKARAGWVRRSTDGWRLPNGQRIRALHEPSQQRVMTRDRSRPVRPAEHHKKITAQQEPTLATSASAGAEVSAYVMSSPPIDGFVPWVAVQATAKFKTNDEWDADLSMTVLGNYLVPNPESNYGIGLLDTGAGISVLGYEVADQLGLFTGGFNTFGTVAIGGVTGTVDAWVSQPFGLWIGGLNQINPDQTLNLAGLVGEWNVSAAMGAGDPDVPDIATAIGSPMAVYFVSWIRNDIWRAVEWNGTTYQGPDVTFHSLTSTAVPSYPNKMPLQLRPTGAADVWYWPCFAALEYCPGGDGSPKIPSVIMGASAQSLFFASSVHLGDQGHAASNQTKFMLDTGAQVTVIGSTVAAQLGLNPNNPEFTVEIEGVDGQIAYMPGFFIDTLDIPATGQWLSYSNVPVVLLDVDSPEGGTLDGILGMNLFVRYNLLLRGGGLPNTPNPSLDFQPLPSINADYSGDGDVDVEDFAYLQTCLSGRDVPQTDSYCEAAFLDGDADVDDHDMLLFINCASGPAVPASPECRGM